MTGLRIGVCVLAALVGSVWAQEQADSAEKPSLAWTAPAGWKQGPEKMLRSVTYYPGGDKQSECFVTILPGTAGGTRANVNRWLSQLGRPEMTDQQVENLPAIKILGEYAPFVSASGTPEGKSAPQGLLGAVCHLDSHTIFVKLTGPKARVEAERDRFLAFCRSLREASGNKPQDVYTPEHPAWKRKHSIRGTVRDESGKPVAGATVSVRERTSGAVAQARTGADGTFVVESLKGAAYSLSVTGKGSAARVDSVAPGGTSLAIVLSAARSTKAEQVDAAKLLSDAEQSYYKKNFAEAFRQFTAAEAKLAKAVAGFRGVAYDFKGESRQRWLGFESKEATKEQLQFAEDATNLTIAHYHLGKMCADGQGVARDPKAAFDWYSKAVRGRGPGTKVGYEVTAARALATAYLHGDGVGEDVEQAFSWMRKAHVWDMQRAKKDEDGDIAMLAKGNFYTDALRVLEPAAKNGNPKAQFYLGEIYFDSDLRSAKYATNRYDAQKAIGWYGKAAAGNYVPALMKLAGEFDRAKKPVEAFGWYRKAAELGDARAQKRLAVCYYTGTGVAKNIAKGHEWMQKSVERDPPGMCEFAMQFMTGKGTGPLSGETIPKDEKRGAALMLLSAQRNHGRAQRALASMYSTGAGVPKDLAKAKHWLFAAANNGDTDAQYIVGTIYDTGRDMFTGKTFPRDAKAAFRWFWLAANPKVDPKTGHLDRADQRAFYAVAVCFFYGNGVRKDRAKAKHWMRRAIDGVGDGVIADSARNIPQQAQKFWDENFK